MQTEAQRIFAKEHIWVDNMGFSTEHVREAIRVFGSERVVFGTDYGAVPISPTEHVEIVQSIELPKDDEERVSAQRKRTLQSRSRWWNALDAEPATSRHGTRASLSDSHVSVAAGLCNLAAR